MDLSKYEEVASDADDFRFGVISIFSRRSDNRLVLAHVMRAKTSDEFDKALQSAKKRKELSHPNLLECYELVANEKAMEVLQVLEYPNTDLFEASEQLKYPAEQIRLLKDIIGALAYLESQGSSHGDVRPEYIHYSEKGKYLLVDRLADQLPLLEHQLNVLSEENEIFTSPEVMRVLSGASQQVEASPAQVDLFSLGMTLTEVVFGEGALQVFYDKAKKTFREEAFAKFLDDLEAQYEEQENGKLGAFIARRLLAIDPSARRTATETHSALLEIFAEELRLEREDLEPRGPKLESGNLPSPQVSLESQPEQAAPAATYPETETSKNKNVFKLLRKKQDNEYLYHERAGGLDSQEGSVINRQSVNNSVTSLTLSAKPHANEVVVEDRELHSEKNVFKNSNFEELPSDRLEKSEAAQIDNLGGSESRNPKTSQSNQHIHTNANLKNIQASHSALSDKNLKSLETSQKTPIETNLVAQDSEVLRSLPLDDIDSGQFIDESTPHRPLNKQIAPLPANESPRSSPVKLLNNYSLSNLGPSDSKAPIAASSALKAEDSRQPGESNPLEHGKSGSSRMLESMNETLNRVSGTHEISPSHIDSQLITSSAEHINQSVEKVNLKRIFSKNAVPATGDSEPEISNNHSPPKSMTVLSLQGDNAFRAGAERSDGQTQMVQSFKATDSGRGISSQNAFGGSQELAGSRNGIGISLETNEFGRLEEAGLKSAISFGGSNSQFLQASGLNELQEISNDIGNFKRSEKDLVASSQQGVGKESLSGPFSDFRDGTNQSATAGKETSIESVRASQDRLEAIQKGGQKGQVSDKNRESQQGRVQDAQTGSQRAMNDAQTGSQRAMNDAQTGSQRAVQEAQQAIDGFQIDSQTGLNDPHSGVQSGQQDVQLANKKGYLDFKMDSEREGQAIQTGSERGGFDSQRLIKDSQLEAQNLPQDIQIGSQKGLAISNFGGNEGSLDGNLSSQRGIHDVRSGQDDVHLANKKGFLDYQMGSEREGQAGQIGSGKGGQYAPLGSQKGPRDGQSDSLGGIEDALIGGQKGIHGIQSGQQDVRLANKKGLLDYQMGSEKAGQDIQLGSERRGQDSQLIDHLGEQNALLGSQKGLHGVQSGQQDVQLANKKGYLDFQMDSQKGIQDVHIGSEREGQNSQLIGHLGEQNALLGSQKGLHGVQSGQQDVQLANKKGYLDFQMDSQKGIQDVKLGSEREGQNSQLIGHLGEQDVLLGSQKELHDPHSGVQSGQQDIHLANKKKLLDFQMDSQKGIQDVEIGSGSERGVILSNLGNQQGATDHQFGGHEEPNGVRFGNKNESPDGITDNKKGNDEGHSGAQEAQQDVHLESKKKRLDFQLGSERGGPDALLGSQKGIHEIRLGSQKGLQEAQIGAQQGVVDAQRGIQGDRSEIQMGVRDSQSATRRGVQDAQTGSQEKLHDAQTGSQRAMRDAQTGLHETTITNQRGSKATQQDPITNVSVHPSENQKEKLTGQSDIQSAGLHQLERTQKDELRFTMEGQRDPQSRQLESQTRIEAIHQEIGKSGQIGGGLVDGKESSDQIQGSLSHGAHGELKEGRDGNIGLKIANFAGTNADLRSQTIDSPNGLTDSRRLVRATLKDKITSAASELTIPSDRLVQPLNPDAGTHLEAVDYADSAWKEKVEGSEAVRLDSERVLVDSAGVPRATGEAAVGARGCAGVQAGLAQMFSKAVQTDKSFLQRNLQPLLASAAEESRVLYCEGQTFPAKLTKLRHTCRRKLDFSVQSIRTLMAELEPPLNPSTPQPLYRIQAATQHLNPSTPQPFSRIETTQVSHFITGAPLYKAPYPLYQRTSLRRVETPSISSTQFKKPNLDQSGANRYVVSRSPARRMQI